MEITEREDMLVHAIQRANKAVDAIVELRNRGMDIQCSEMAEASWHLLMAMKDIDRAKYDQV